MKYLLLVLMTAAVNAQVSPVPSEVDARMALANCKSDLQNKEVLYKELLTRREEKARDDKINDMYAGCNQILGYFASQKGRLLREEWAFCDTLKTRMTEQLKKQMKGAR